MVGEGVTMDRRLALSLCIAAAFGGSALGQAPIEPEYNGSPLVRVWSPADYGGHSQNWAVHAAPNGLIYVANNRGLLEFDGVAWRLIELPGGTGARSVISDAQGRIWVGAGDTICVLEPNATGALVARSVTENLRPGGEALGTFFWAIPEDGGRALIFVAEKLAVRIGSDGKPSIVATGPTPARGYLWEGGVPAIRFGNSTVGWQWGLVRDGRYEDAPGLLPLGAMAQCAPDGEGGMMVFGLTDIARWRAGKLSERKRLAAVAENDTVRAVVALDGGNRYALATLRGGVLVVDREGQAIARWTRADGLPDSSIRALALDQQGGLWLATNNGIARLQVDSPVRVATGGRGLEQSLQALTGDAAGRLWAGGSQGILLREKGAARFQLLEDFPTDVHGLAIGAEREMLVTGRGVVTGRDALALPTQIDRSTTATGDPVLVLDGQAAVVPEVFSVGLYQRGEHGWSRRVTLAGTAGSIYSLAVSGDGWLWIVRGSREVLRVRIDAGLLQAQAEVVGREAGADPALLGRTRVLSWAGSIWLAGAHGLLRWDPAASRFIEPPEVPEPWRRSGYGHARALADGALWLVRRAGGEAETRLSLLRLAWVDGQITALEFGSPAVTAFNTQSLWLDAPAQRLWVGGFGGLVRLDLTGRNGQERRAPAAILRRVSTRDREIYGGRTRQPGESIRLATAESSLRFEFAAPWYPADQRGASPLRWRSRLLSFDGDWSPWSAETRRDYTNLPPGDYVFQTQAMAWGEPGAIDQYVFNLPPPWWRAWWILAGGILLALGGIVLITREISQRALRARVARLEAQAGIERERLRIARDMHDDLGSSLGRVALLSERGLEHADDRTASEDAFRRIRETAQSLSAATRDIIWAVNPQNDTLAGTLDHVSNWVEGTAADAGLRCFVELPADIPARTVGSQRRHALLLALKEATNNLVKYAEATEVRFAATLDSRGVLTITLRDNGRGFTAGEVRGSGHGTASIGARLTALGGSGRIESQPGQGTTVTLQLPLGTVLR